MWAQKKKDTKSKVLDIRNALSELEGSPDRCIKLTEMPCLLAWRRTQVSFLNHYTVTGMRNSPESGELREAKLNSDQRRTRWFFQSCDVREEVDSVDRSFTCSHFERAFSPSRHLEKEDKSWCLIPLWSSVQRLLGSNKLPVFSKNLILLSGFSSKHPGKNCWGKDYPKEQWMAVLVCSSAAESNEKYYFLKEKSSISSIFWKSITWAWV